MNEVDLWQVWEQLEARVISPPPVSLCPVPIQPGTSHPPHAAHTLSFIKVFAAKWFNADEHGSLFVTVKLIMKEPEADSMRSWLHFVFSWDLPRLGPSCPFTVMILCISSNLEYCFACLSAGFMWVFILTVLTRMIVGYIKLKQRQKCFVLPDFKENEKWEERSRCWSMSSRAFDTFECARVNMSAGFGVDKARNRDKVTDCPGKPLALSSHCIVGNTAWHDHRSRKMNFPPWAQGFGVINKVNVTQY